MKKIAILTGGGDAPGLNAVIRAAVKTAIYEYDCEVIGVRDGYDGFIDEQGITTLLHISIIGGLLACLYATYRIFKRLALTSGTPQKLRKRSSRVPGT